MTSTDGINWTIRSVPNGGFPEKISFVNGKFIAQESSDDNILAWVSSDGINWLTHYVPDGGTNTREFTGEWVYFNDKYIQQVRMSNILFDNGFYIELLISSNGIDFTYNTYILSNISITMYAMGTPFIYQSTLYFIFPNFIAYTSDLINWNYKISNIFSMNSYINNTAINRNPVTSVWLSDNLIYNTISNYSGDGAGQPMIFKSFDISA
jgi:hypothetical protein